MIGQLASDVSPSLADLTPGASLRMLFSFGSPLSSRERCSFPTTNFFDWPNRWSMIGKAFFHFLARGASQGRLLNSLDKVGGV